MKVVLVKVGKKGVWWLPFFYFFHRLLTWLRWTAATNEMEKSGFFSLYFFVQAAAYSPFFVSVGM
ncbi:MAG: hypothetical protein JOS17DRAFT_754602 [Linnemannia elongata]|nr:MAG: hypothetical protein JOS17DRAFT_754602 [Linnemannia elongata]